MMVDRYKNTLIIKDDGKLIDTELSHEQIYYAIIPKIDGIGNIYSFKYRIPPFGEEKDGYEFCIIIGDKPSFYIFINEERAKECREQILQAIDDYYSGRGDG